MAELHIVGEIVGASGFEERNLFCKVRRVPVPSSRPVAPSRPRERSKNKPSPPAPVSTTHPEPSPDAYVPNTTSNSQWGVEAGSMWDVVEGEAGGQTHCCYPPEGEPSVVWSHPVDVHYAAKSLVGWPKMWFQVWHMDEHGLKDLCGYGFCHVPTGPGMHEVEVCTWCPEGSPLEKLQAFFIGGKPRLKYEEVIHSPGDRFRLATRAAGVIKLQLGVCVKDFDKYNVAH
jgi:B9 domain-containing protein 2